MSTGDLVTGSDGQFAIRVGPWAKEKLHYIKRYCDIFNAGMKNQWAIRTYVDLFSGPGLCVVGKTSEEVKGSPLVALDCEVPFTHYFFNDENSATINALKIRTEAYRIVSIEFFNKHCNSVVDELRQKLPPNSLDFCFVDPFKWEISFESIRKLTSQRRIDLAITFHVGSIKRVANKPPSELMDFFPDSRWKSEYQKAEEAGRVPERVILEAYERGLRDIGYGEIKDYVLMANKTNVPLYYLVFASKHKRGADFWDKIAERSETGQMRMKGMLS